VIGLWLTLAVGPLDPLAAAARQADARPPFSLMHMVRGSSADPLTADDVAEALPHVETVLTDETFAAIDAATASLQCALPIDGTRLGALADLLLVAATIDAASGKPFLAGVQLARASDVARLLWRCDGATLDTLSAGLAVQARFQTRVSLLLEQGWLDQAGAMRAMAALIVPTDAELLRCAGPAPAKADLEPRRQERRRQQKTIGLLVDKLRAVPATLPDGERLEVTDVSVRCTPGADAEHVLVSRAVLAVLRKRGAAAILGDAQLGMPVLGAQGLEGVTVARAGPGTLSCGLRDGDVLLAVNDQPMAALVGMGGGLKSDGNALGPSVARDQRVVLTVRRGGTLVTLSLEPKDPVR
jgi:hypothetical protein